MKRYVKLLLKSLKYAGLLSGVTIAGAFGYLQYINSIIGPIEIDHAESTKFYREQYKMEGNEAEKMYYWLLFDISSFRILSYGGYLKYCKKLSEKIINPAIENYERAGLIKRIGGLSDTEVEKPDRKLFDEVNAIRKRNLETFEAQEYIVKELRKRQKMMDTRKIVGLSEQQLKKIELVQRYVCRAGVALGVGEVRSYVSQIPLIQSRLPGDNLHKIMFI